MARFCSKPQTGRAPLTIYMGVRAFWDRPEAWHHTKAAGLGGQSLPGQPGASSRAACHRASLLSSKYPTLEPRNFPGSVPVPSVGLGRKGRKLLNPCQNKVVQHLHAHLPARTGFTVFKWACFTLLCRSSQRPWIHMWRPAKASATYPLLKSFS